MAYLFGPLSITGSSITISGSVTSVPASGSTTTSTGPFISSGSSTEFTGSFITSGSSTTIGNQVVTGSIITSGSINTIGNTTITGSLIVSGANSTIVVPTYPSGSQPSLPTTGSMFFDYITNYLYIFNGTTWKSGSFV